MRQTARIRLNSRKMQSCIFNYLQYITIHICGRLLLLNGRELVLAINKFLTRTDNAIILIRSFIQWCKSFQQQCQQHGNVCASLNNRKDWTFSSDLICCFSFLLHLCEIIKIIYNWVKVESTATFQWKDQISSEFLVNKATFWSVQ